MSDWKKRLVMRACVGGVTSKQMMKTMSFAILLASLTSPRNSAPVCDEWLDKKTGVARVRVSDEWLGKKRGGESLNVEGVRSKQMMKPKPFCLPYWPVQETQCQWVMNYRKKRGGNENFMSEEWHPSKWWNHCHVAYTLLLLVSPRNLSILSHWPMIIAASDWCETSAYNWSVALLVKM